MCTALTGPSLRWSASWIAPLAAERPRSCARRAGVALQEFDDPLQVLTHEAYRCCGVAIHDGLEDAAVFVRIAVAHDDAPQSPLRLLSSRQERIDDVEKDPVPRCGR